MTHARYGKGLRWAFGVLAIATIGTVGCLDTATGPSPVSIEDTKFAESLGIDLDAMKKTPDGLYYLDITVGDGAPVEEGDSIAIHYTGWLADGTKFDSNTDREAFWFTIGKTNLIAGWHLGIPGMFVGGKRRLVIPYYLAYGPYSYGPIPQYANLVFDVEVVDLHVDEEEEAEEQ